MPLKQTIPVAERNARDKPLVLVVDDDHSHRKLLELLADRLDITTYLSASCEEALAALDQYSFDVILMDCRMPDVDGFACTQRIRRLSSRNRTIPIIAITAQTTEDDRQKCLLSGMDDYLAKPFTLDQLQQKLDIWLKNQNENVLNGRQEAN